jgi:hypothetical protein
MYVLKQCNNVAFAETSLSIRLSLISQFFSSWWKLRDAPERRCKRLPFQTLRQPRASQLYINTIPVCIKIAVGSEAQ